MEPDTVRDRLQAELQRAAALEQAERALLGAEHDGLFDELTTVDQHTADMASDMVEREQALTILEMAEEHRHNIEHAIQKLRSGQFGRCETCGATISDERLEAVPDARFCEAHQRDWELGRLGLVVGPMPEAPPESPEPGWRELDLLPDDDEDVPRRQDRTAEEAAMHLDPEEHDDNPTPPALRFLDR